MKKTILLALVIALAFVLITCDDNKDTHTHTWSDWQSNDTEHWKECTANDGAKTGIANHTSSPCTVCGYDSLQNWTAVTDSTFGTSGIYAIAYGNGRFVAGGGGGKMAYSDDRETWTAVEDSTIGTSGIYAIAYGNGRFVAGGDDGKMAYSDDNGETWTAVSDSTFGTSEIRAVAYGNGKWVAVGGSGKMAYSDDNGETWTAVSNSTFPSGQYDYIYGIAYGIADGESVGRFVAVGTQGKMAYSDDNGETWTAVSNSTFGTSYIGAIAYGNNRFVAVGGSGKMAYSDDNGVSWTAVSNSTFGSATNGTSNINAIAYGIADGASVGRFVAVGSSGKMATSSDGVTWTAVADSTIWEYTNSAGNPVTARINAIAYGKNRFVAVGDSGKMAYSADGVTWTAVADSTIWEYTNSAGNPVTASINAIAYGKNRFVAVDSSGKMAYADW